MDDNRIPDDIFKQAVAKAREIETSVFEKKCKDMDVHTFSEKYLERMKILKMGEREVNDSKIASYSVKKKSTKVKILLIAAIVMLMGTMTVLAVEPLREKVYELIEIIFPDHTYVSFKELSQEIQNQNGSTSIDEFRCRKLKNVPEKYKLKNEDVFYEIGFYFVEYYDSNNQIIRYQQELIDYYDWTITGNREKAEKISINNDEGYLLTDNEQYHSIIYPYEGYVYSIGGYNDVEELVSLLESVFIETDSQNEKGNINNYPLKLEKVPEGYTLHIEDDLYEEFGVYDYLQIFHNEDEKSILYEQIDINEIDLYSLIVSSDGTPAEEITICGEKAYVLTDEVQRNSVLYPRIDFIFMISGQEDVESLVECLESLFEEE